MWELILEQFDDLLVKILLLAAIISFVSIFMFVLVFILSFMQSVRKGGGGGEGCCAVVDKNSHNSFPPLSISSLLLSFYVCKNAKLCHCLQTKLFIAHGQCCI